MSAASYETEEMLCKYLLFHYGNEKDLMPFSFDLNEALDFPVRSVKECLDVESLPKEARAIDLGCAVGRSSFELAKSCLSVLAIDQSSKFIDAAKQIQGGASLEYQIVQEGGQNETRWAVCPKGVDPNRVEFRCGDLLHLKELQPFDVVFTANVLCRLKEPRSFLYLLEELTAPRGQLILVTPFSWQEHYTPKNKWLTSQEVDRILKRSFTLKRSFDLPFLLREHLRKYEWVVPRATIWVKSS